MLLRLFLAIALVIILLVNDSTNEADDSNNFKNYDQVFKTNVVRERHPSDQSDQPSPRLISRPIRSAEEFFQNQISMRSYHRSRAQKKKSSSGIWGRFKEWFSIIGGWLKAITPSWLSGKKKAKEYPSSSGGSISTRPHESVDDEDNGNGNEHHYEEGGGGGGGGGGMFNGGGGYDGGGYGGGGYGYGQSWPEMIMSLIEPIVTLISTFTELFTGGRRNNVEEMPQQQEPPPPPPPPKNKTDSESD